MQKRLPSFRGIEAFMVTANSLNLRLASARLNISISAVSRRIRSLEEEIGAQLFVRGGRKLSLTAAGYHYHRQLLPTLDIIHQATRSVESQDRDSISILALPSFVTSWLVPRLPAFLSSYPQVNIEFATLRKRRLGFTDLIIEPRFEADEYMGMTRLFQWISTPACRVDLIKEHQIKAPNDIMKFPLIDLDSPVSVWPSWIEKANVSEENKVRWIRFDNFLSMLGAVQAGLGFSMMALFYLVRDKSLAHPFEIATSLTGGVFLQNPSGFERPIVQRFREWIMDEVSDTTKALPKWS